MKYITILLALLFAASASFAQLLNPDFEEWDGDNPIGWGNFNFPDIFQAVRPSENAFFGNYAAELMITEQFGGSIINQQIAVRDVDETVTLELHYAGLPEGTNLAVALAASFEGLLIDASADAYENHGTDYQSATLVWNPQFENYDTLAFYFTFSSEESMAGSVLLDHLVLTGVTGLGVNTDIEPVVNRWELSGIYPNPFNSTTTINFNLPSVTGVDLAVYDMSGRRVAVLAGGIFQAGNHRLIWTPEALSGGIYIVRLSAGGQVFNVRAIHLK